MSTSKAKQQINAHQNQKTQQSKLNNKLLNLSFSFCIFFLLLHSCDFCFEKEQNYFFFQVLENEIIFGD